MVPLQSESVACGLPDDTGILTALIFYWTGEEINPLILASIAGAQAALLYSSCDIFSLICRFLVGWCGGVGAVSTLREAYGFLDKKQRP